VNVNTTDATTGVTALFLPVCNGLHNELAFERFPAMQLSGLGAPVRQIGHGLPLASGHRVL
jgi:hypothetical protein